MSLQSSRCMKNAQGGISSLCCGMSTGIRANPIDGVEEMRMLMTEYMGYEMDTLMKDEEFQDLIVADGGAPLGDFMKMVVKRIS